MLRDVSKDMLLLLFPSDIARNPNTNLVINYTHYSIYQLDLWGVH